MIILDYNLKLEENSYYDMKTIGIRKHDVMIHIQNKRLTWNRIEFINQVALEKYMNVDIMENIYKLVMIHTTIGGHTWELELVWLLKWYAEAMALFLGLHVPVYDDYLCSKWWIFLWYWQMS